MLPFETHPGDFYSARLTKSLPCPTARREGRGEEEKRVEEERKGG